MKRYFFHRHKWHLIVVFTTGFAAVLPFFHCRFCWTFSEFLPIPFVFCFFSLLFGWVLLSWIPAGTTPDARFVFMDTRLLQRTLGIFWDPLSKALTSCRRRVSVLQPISFPTSRHRSSLAICYKTVARCTVPTKGICSRAEKFLPLFFSPLFLILKSVQKAWDKGHQSASASDQQKAYSEICFGGC